MEDRKLLVLLRNSKISEEFDKMTQFIFCRMFVRSFKYFLNKKISFKWLDFIIAIDMKIFFDFTLFI